MNKELSTKIKIISLVCTFMVVWRHSTNMVAFYGGYQGVPVAVSFIEWSFSRATDIAVPTFFFLSGFFFFRTNFCSIINYWEIIKKKVRTLLIPFLIWNIMGFFILLAANEIHYPDSIQQFLLSVANSSYDGVLWYVRNLMIMMFLAPLYSWIFAINKWRIYIPALMVLSIWWHPVDCSIWSSEGWFFFVLGGVAYNKRLLSVKHFPSWHVFAMSVVWLLLCLCHPFGGIVFTKISILWGMATLWMMVDIISHVWKALFLKVADYCFFIYVSHMYVIKTMKVSIAMMFPNNEYAALTAYFVLPIITFFLLLFIGQLWNKYHPKSFSIAMGGRT